MPTPSPMDAIRDAFLAALRDGKVSFTVEGETLLYFLPVRCGRDKSEAPNKLQIQLLPELERFHLRIGDRGLVPSARHASL